MTSYTDHSSTEQTKITVNWQVVTPAYGRDYKNAKAAKEGFLSGVDFNLNSVQYGFCYCSVRDFASGTRVNVRYNALRSVCTVVVP